MPFKVDYTLFKTSVISYAVLFIPIHLIFYKTGRTLRHSYRNKANSVRLLSVSAGFYHFFHCPGKILSAMAKTCTIRVSDSV